MMPIAVASQGPRTRKSRKLYRTATAQNDSASTRNNSDHACAIRCYAFAQRIRSQHRAPQDETDTASAARSGRAVSPVAPATPRDNSGTSQAAASRLISKSRKPRLKPVAREECDRDRKHDEVVVEHVGRREQAAAGERGGLEFEGGVAVPQPRQACGEHQRQRALQRHRRSARWRPSIRAAEKIDWIFSQPVPPCSSTTVCVKFMEFDEGVPDAAAERGKADQRPAPPRWPPPRRWCSIGRPASSATGISTPNCGL